jgi:CubicO group peptidase (beta-lactamase class C family)
MERLSSGLFRDRWPTAPQVARPMDGARVSLSSKGVSRGMKLNAEELRLHDARSYKSGFLAVALGAFTFAAANCNGLTATQDTTEPIWPTNGWLTSTPEEQGMDSKQLADLVDFGAMLKLSTGGPLCRTLDSLLVVRHGKMVAEAYYAPYAAGIPHAAYSVTKSVISTLTAIASKEGLLDSISHRVLDYFDRSSIANLDERKEAITVQNLFDMTSGLEWTEQLGTRIPDIKTDEQMFSNSNWVKFILDRPMSSAPGDTFNYDSGNPHLLSAILTKLTGHSALDYAKAKLFGPLGISDVSWFHDPQGISSGGVGLWLEPRDMAKIGYLYLRNGEWEGKQLLPDTWIDKVRHGTKASGLQYSNLFWELPDKHVYYASGRYGQTIIVFPDLDVVAVTTGRVLFSVNDFADLIFASVRSDTALPPNPADAKELANRTRDVATEKPTPVGPASKAAASISGKVYRFSPNSIYVKSVSLMLNDPQPRCDVEFYPINTTTPTPRFAGPIGLDGKYRQAEPTYNQWLAFRAVSALKGTWLDDHTFMMDWLTLGQGPANVWTFTFDGDKLNLQVTRLDGSKISAIGNTGG